eukprot:3518285-Amphidinium_carterae.1
MQLLPSCIPTTVWQGDPHRPHIVVVEYLQTLFDLEHRMHPAQQSLLVVELLLGPLCQTRSQVRTHPCFPPVPFGGQWHHYPQAHPIRVQAL